MTYRYGFELEGFYIPMLPTTGLLDAGREIKIPPKEYPTDGFPGIVELRTYGDHSLEQAWAGIIIEGMKYKDVDYTICWHTFSPQEKRELRKRPWTKDQQDVRNIYGKKPRALGNKSMASLQINVSNRYRAEFYDDKGVRKPAEFQMFDSARIVQALDETFAVDIKESKRQPGEYCIKGDRLEYRSLPNFVFPFEYQEAAVFLEKIRKAVEQ